MEKIFLNLLILFVILTQAIATLAGEHIDLGKSSGLHVRQKRLIDRRAYGNKPIRIQRAAYTVNIQKRGLSHCAGGILSPTIFATAAHCFDNQTYKLTILSGSSWRRNGTVHNIVRIVNHPYYNPITLAFDLALVRVNPFFQLGMIHNRKIDLFEGKVRPKTSSLFSSWGCITTSPINIFPEHLRIIEIPIMGWQLCQQYYGKAAFIQDGHICALDTTGRLGSCDGDDGGPLAVNNQLVGIMSFRKGSLNGKTPEVFTDVSHPNMRKWILSTIENNAIWFGHPHYQEIIQ